MSEHDLMPSFEIVVGSWNLVSNSHVRIALSRYGPARRVAESPFLIVVGIILFPNWFQ